MQLFYSIFVSVPRHCPGMPVSNIALTAPLFPCAERIVPLSSFFPGLVHVTFFPTSPCAFSLVSIPSILIIMWLWLLFLLLPLKLAIVASISFELCGYLKT